MKKMLRPATNPNSFKISLLVSANTAKPMAAVMLQNKVTTPILLTISMIAWCLSNPAFMEVWYLLKK